MHHLGDIYLQSVDWVKARKAYQRIIALTPADAIARQRLMEVALKLGDRQAAITQLDELAPLCAAQDAGQELAPLLREMGLAYPKDVDVQSRLAAPASNSPCVKKP